MSTPSKGAMRAGNDCYKSEVAVLDPGYYPGEAQIEFSIEKAARIIDNHTNAIADELAAALRLALPFVCFSDNEGRSPDDYPEVVKMINTQRAEAESALARYQQLKAKETP